MTFARFALPLFAFAFAFAFASTAASADEPQRLDAEKSKHFGKMVADAVGKLNELPFKLSLDGAQAMGMTAKDRGAMLVPDAGLTLEKLAKADREIVPVGVLVMHRVALSVVGETVAADKLRSADFTHEDKTATASILPLGAARVAGRLVLLVYGKDKEPLVVGTLRDIDHTNITPLELDVQGVKDGLALVTIGLLGKHKAVLIVVAQE